MAPAHSSIQYRQMFWYHLIEENAGMRKRDTYMITLTVKVNKFRPTKEVEDLIGGVSQCCVFFSYITL